MQRTSITMLIERETKGAVRYQEIDPARGNAVVKQSDPNCLIGTLYIRKSMLSAAPAKIKVTVEEA